MGGRKLSRLSIHSPTRQPGAETLIIAPQQGCIKMSRGFFRLWVVASAVWVAVTVLALFHDNRPDALQITLEASLVPPAILLALGFMLRWALTGFSGR